MKRISRNHIWGAGLGIGLACFGITHLMTGSTPDTFKADLGEFNALTDFNHGTPLRLDKVTSGVRLAQFDTNEHDSNQMSLPGLVRVVESDLQLAPQLNDPELPMIESGSSSSDSFIIPDEMGHSTQSVEMPELMTHAKPGTELPLLATEAKLAQQAPASSGNRGFEISGSAWKSNPFLNEAQSPVAKTKLAQPSTEESVFMGGANSEVGKFPASPDRALVIEESKPLEVSIFNIPEEREGTIANSSESIIELEQMAQADKAIKGLVLPVATERFMTQPTMAPTAAVANSGLTQSVAQKAAHHIEYGKSLARRGAFHAARQEFYSGLKVLAQAQDSNSGSPAYSLALRDGIMAMKEAEEFMVLDTESQMGLSVEAVVETHRIGLLSSEEQKRMTPIQAMQKYFAFAEQQLKKAGGSNVVAAEALYCLGKLHSLTSQKDPSPGRLDVAKAIVYHRAALNGNSQNYRSANELGVLMAKSGQFDQAKELLKQSLMIRQAPEAWENLTKIHERLGETHLAQLANQERNRVIFQATNQSQLIQWMPAESFNALAPVEFPAMQSQVADGQIRKQSQPTEADAPVRQAEAQKPLSRFIDSLKLR